MANRSFDTGHWVRMEADQLLDDMPEAELLGLAFELDAKAEVYDGGARMAHDVASELRRRAASGVRFWSPALVEPET